jgi:glycosyltransferase involved in cell wall biosynthesis
VCFSGARDHYQVAQALAEAGLLERLVTDLYFDPEGGRIRRGLARLFPRLLARHNAAVPGGRVLTTAATLVDSLLLKTALANRSRQIRLDRRLGRLARHEAWKSRSPLFSYSYYAAEAFAPGRRRPARRFLFQLHPHPCSVRQVLKEEMLCAPAFALSLKREHEIGAPEEHFTALCDESRLANGWVVASTYTARTLIENGVPGERIHVVPYGVDATRFPARDKAPPNSQPFRIIWVGSMVQRKGLSYFLEAVRGLPQEGLEVLVCGNHAVEERAIQSYGIPTLRVLRALPTGELARLLRASDLFVLPSLAEGFGHVILEAMSSGVPVVTTPSTCAPDVLVDGVHGFVVPIRDSAALANRMAWGREHRQDLYRMGVAAAGQARTFTWQRFRSGIVKAYLEMTEETPLSDPASRGL